MAAAEAARDAASERDEQAWRNALKVRPRTWHHLWMLLAHVAEHFDDYQDMDNEPDVFGALIGAVNGLRLASKELTAKHNLSLLSPVELDELADFCRHQSRILSAFQYRASDPETALGSIYDLESTRIGILGDQAREEISRRQPKNEADKGYRLEAMIKGDLAGNGYIEPSLLAEAVAAWGAV